MNQVNRNPVTSTVGAPVADNGLTCPACAYNLTGLASDRCPECGRESAIADAVDAAANPKYPALKRGAWIIAIVVMTAYGLTDSSQPNAKIEYGVGIMITILTCYWTWVDSIERKRLITKGELAVLLLCSPIGLLYYLGRQRRVTSILLFFVLVVAALTATIAGFVLGELLRYGVWPTFAVY